MSNLTDVMFSSKIDNWSTPQYLFDELNKEFHFNIDVCADLSNHKCSEYYTKEINGLSKPWTGVAWCNPPYGREISKWVEKASKESFLGNTVVMLIPARTDTRWFHKYIYNKPNVEIRFIKGRLKFGNAVYNAPFPSMIVIFKGAKK